MEQAWGLTQRGRGISQLLALKSGFIFGSMYHLQSSYESLLPESGISAHDLLPASMPQGPDSAHFALRGCSGSGCSRPCAGLQGDMDDWETRFS